MSDYESPSVFWQTRPRARKDHKCCECGNTIQRGEHYWRFAGVWDREFNHYKVCTGCEELRELLRAEEVETYLGGLYECMEEAENPIPAMEVLGAMAT